MEELSKTYNPKKTENKIYKLWLQSDAFKPSLTSETSSLKSFSIVIPPPNVTGSLHMGHALNNTIQDILIRRARMQGKPTLWLPGTDHAGIATQNVVEKALAKEGKNRNDLGREEFVARVWQWVDQYGDIIIDQLKKMGCSCDWSRKRFTMDEDYQEAVNTAFKHYFDKGWIYQADRVINWCVRCQTSLSDIEVEYNEVPAKLYYFKYDKNFPITIATTRPETKLGDVAVAVNPDDKRYKEYIGKTYNINFAGIKRKIKIIADKSIDPKFGTGAVGVTPAHSLIDAELAKIHKLSSITVIDKFGRINLVIPPPRWNLNGLKVAEARKKIVEILNKDNLIEKTEEYTHNLSVCYRCGREIEPQPSKQWFLKMSELIKPAIKAIESGEIKITPDRWKKVYLDWMENIRDWCISRQIWWGHKIPIDGETDVLDTWFSSALWPFATLGWPTGKCHAGLDPASSPSGILNQVQDDKSSDLDRFYPTTVLSTARDINMLWVVRMIFSGYEFMNKKPFSEVYIHPTVFNKEGKRMSKSLGTGVDPLMLIDKYGADAMRFGLTYINTGTQDIKFDENAILMGQKFANKIWNISRFVMQNSSVIANLSSVIASEAKQSIIDDGLPRPDGARNDADKQILSKLAKLENSLNDDLNKFKFGQAAHNLYDFIWHDFADVYIEEYKKTMIDRHDTIASRDDKSSVIASERSERGNLSSDDSQVLLYVLITSLKLLHPFMPFLTEEIWQNLYEQKLVVDKMLIAASWPKI